MMNKVTPTETSCTGSSKATAGKSVGMLVTMAVKVFGVMSRTFDRNPSPSLSDDSSLQSGPYTSRAIPVAAAYTQSSTRKLAFGSATETAEVSKPLDDFYNSSTLTNVSKAFCAAVLVAAFLLIMSRSIQFVAYHDEFLKSSTSSASVVTEEAVEENRSTTKDVEIPPSLSTILKISTVS
ncbi:unnamed protein product [Caenorhabditis auriculariae]|uniref:Uncharacterized protein n=1 Tax=Caenorhabditis auriculariae TaxID=2777116 RepID=A0A8S1GTN7_9PELO|nr:unnamed protein product [Caenorhabditis auriculariae]